MNRIDGKLAVAVLALSIFSVTTAYAVMPEYQRTEHRQNGNLPEPTNSEQSGTPKVTEVFHSSPESQVDLSEKGVAPQQTMNLDMRRIEQLREIESIRETVLTKYEMRTSTRQDWAKAQLKIESRLLKIGLEGAAFSDAQGLLLNAKFTRFTAKDLFLTYLSRSKNVPMEIQRWMMRMKVYDSLKALRSSDLAKDVVQLKMDRALASLGFGKGDRSLIADQLVTPSRANESLEFIISGYKPVSNGIFSRLGRFGEGVRVNRAVRAMDFKEPSKTESAIDAALKARVE